MQVDLEESLEPGEVEGELFFRACAVQSRVEESHDDKDIFEGHDKGTATSRKGSQSMISLDKIK